MGNSLDKKDKFDKKGCYTCLSCGKKTRETGDGESDVQLCKKCFRDSQMENMYSDASETILCSCGSIATKLVFEPDNEYFDGIDYVVYHCAKCDIDFYNNSDGTREVIS